MLFARLCFGLQSRKVRTVFNTAQRAMHPGQNWVFKGKTSCMNLIVNVDHGVLEQVCCPHEELCLIFLVENYFNFFYVAFW